jgi:hypothetical protein
MTGRALFDEHDEDCRLWEQFGDGGTDHRPIASHRLCVTAGATTVNLLS